MTKYDIIFEALQEKVNSGELTMKNAQILNNVAFEKYGGDETEYEEVTESVDDSVTYEEYLEAMEEELFGEATRYKKEQEKLVKKMDIEKRNIKNYEKRDDEIERIAYKLKRDNKFDDHVDQYDKAKKENTDKLNSSKENLEKMKKSKLYTGDEEVTATDHHGNKRARTMHIGSTLFYGKTKAKEKAEERDDRKKYGIAIHDGTYDDLIKQKIQARKLQDKKRGLNQN